MKYQYNELQWKVQFLYVIMATVIFSHVRMTCYLQVLFLQGCFSAAANAYCLEIAIWLTFHKHSGGSTCNFEGWNDRMVGWHKFTQNPKRWNDGKLPQILKIHWGYFIILAFLYNKCGGFATSLNKLVIDQSESYKSLFFVFVKQLLNSKFENIITKNLMTHFYRLIIYNFTWHC